MRVLLLGGSSIVGRRVRPALLSLPDVDAVDAASRRGRDVAAALAANGGVAYAGYDEALAESAAGLVYVSGENAVHAELALAALDSGRHVVVDKPAFPDSASTEAAVALARDRGVVLAEATVFLDHPRIAALDATLATAGPVTRVQACFSIPPLAAGNFRYHGAAGGGAIADLGPYAAATCRHLFGRPPRDVGCTILAHTGDGTETAFAVTAGFDGGGSFLGHYGFDTEYQNWLSAAGPRVAVRLERFTTPPPGEKLTLDRRHENAADSVETPAGDSFALMLARVFAALASGVGGERFHDDMIDDARFRDRLKESAR